jgi:hypothetical protein
LAEQRLLEGRRFSMPAERTSRQRGRAFAPAVRRAKDFKLVPQEMPQSKM